MSWGSAVGLHMSRRHSLGFYMVCRLFESILVWFVAAIASLQPGILEEVRSAEILEVGESGVEGDRGRKKRHN